MTDPGPLAGVTVLELGDGLPVSYAGRVLRCLGAAVIKVQAGEPDWLRGYGAGCRKHKHACSWWHLNAAKHRATLEVPPRGLVPALAGLIGAADITIAGTGTISALVEDALDLPSAGEASVVRIVAAVDPPTGIHVPPDESAGMVTGLRDLYGLDCPPEGLRFDLAEVNAGVHAAATATMALARLQADPSPIRVDVGIYESAFSVIEIAAQTVLLSQRFEAESPDMVGSPLAYPYYCSDGGALVINIYGRGVWERTCAAIGREDLADDPRFIETFARYQFAQELREVLDEFCASHTRDEAVARLWAQRIPSAPILDVAELVKNEQVVARGIIQGSTVASPFLINGHRDPMAPASAPAMETAVRAFCRDKFTASYSEELGEVRIVLR